MLKKKEVTIDDQSKETNRDFGKKFLLTEMPALKAERWARHAAAAVSRADLQIREELKHLGMLGFYLLGFQALAGGEIEKIDPLMDEMMKQIQIVETATTRALTPDDIEEVATILRLRKELLELHMGFTFAELALILRNSADPLMTDSQTTQTSQT